MKYQRYRCQSKNRRRAAAAVEFAIVAPVFFLLLFAMVEYGRMVMVQQLLTNASREGARQAVLDGATTEKVKDVVEQYLANARITAQRNDITVTPTPSATAFGDPISITVSVPFTEVSWLPSPLFLGATELQASSAMRRETAQ